MNKSKNSKTYTIQPDIQKEDLPPGTITATCLRCNRTCFILGETNNITTDEQKRYFPCYDKNGYCMNCPGKCYWDTHKNTPYKIIYKTKKVIDKELKEEEEK